MKVPCQSRSSLHRTGRRLPSTLSARKSQSSPRVRRQAATRFSYKSGQKAAPPPHNHPWDESFYVTKGEIAFGINDGAMTIAPPGTLVHLPAGTTHWFRFGKGGGEMISMTSREAASQMFTALDREVSAKNPDLAKLAEVAGRYGLTVP